MQYNNSSILGVGVNYHTIISKEIIKNIHTFDFLEIHTERFFTDVPDPTILKLSEKIPIVMHGLDLSMGSLEMIDPIYFSKLQLLLKNKSYEWFSEHISVTKINHYETGHLMPLPFNDYFLEELIKKVKSISALTQKPFLLENITYYYEMLQSTMSEIFFIKTLLKKSNAYMLLDLNNLYINSINHQYDPYAFLDALPPEKIMQVHLAGGTYQCDMYVDTHAHSISQEVWKLLEYSLKRFPIRGIIIERDDNYNDFYDILKEITLARELLKKYKGNYMLL